MIETTKQRAGMRARWLFGNLIWGLTVIGLVTVVNSVAGDAHATETSSAAVVLVRIDGGGHTWPGSPMVPQGMRAVVLGNTSRDVDAGELMWNFFAGLEPSVRSTSSTAGVPGQWGTTDTSRDITFRDYRNRYVYKDHEIWWAGAKDVRAQWAAIFPNHVDANNGYTWYHADHAKAEPAGNAYFRWDYDKPVPEGTRLLIEGDFPHARYFSISVGAPTSIPAFPPPAGWAATTGDGSGLAEVVIADEDIEPDPGHTNPFRRGANRNAGQRHYHFTFELRNGNASTLNTFQGKDATKPPHRAPGNLRIGGTFKYNSTSREINPSTGKPFGYRGPYVWVRYTLPDGYKKFAGVGLPVIRIQFPGEQPVLAPITREIPTSEGDLLPHYGIDENPALGDSDGRSKMELEGHRVLESRALGSVGVASSPGIAHIPMIWEVFNVRNQQGKVLPEADLTLNVGSPAYTIRWLWLYQQWRLGKYPHDRYLGMGFKKHVADKTYAISGMGAGRQPPRNRMMASDHNVQTAYVHAPVSLGRGELLVIEGKAPRTPRTLAGNPTVEDYDLRYWNLTLQGGGDTGRNRLRLTALADVTDENVVLDNDGRYMIVIGADADRPEGATAENGITWRRWPLGNMMNLLWRFMATDDRFPFRPNQITWEQADYYLGKPRGSATTNRALLRSTMGEYYPRTTYSNTKQMEQRIRKGQTGLEFPLSYKPVVIPPEEPARLGVRIENEGAKRAGARVRLDYGPWRESLSNLTVNAGKHVVDFKSARGYVTPAPQIIELPAGKKISRQVSYPRANGQWTASPGEGRRRFPDGGIEWVTVANGNLVVGGDFRMINRVKAKHIAEFRNGRWRALGSGLDGKPETLVAYDGGVVAGGWFEKPGKRIAWWKDGKWRALGEGMEGDGGGVRALAVHQGALYAGGEFSKSGRSNALHVARWDGRDWKPLGAGMRGTLGVRTGRDGAGWVYALTTYKDKLIAGGNFVKAGEGTAHNVAQWDERTQTWSPMGTGLNSRVYGFGVYRGELYATGDFTHAGEVEVNHIARWDGNRWQPVSTGLWDLYNAFGRTLVVYDDKLVVGGGFRTAGGVTAHNIALWDGKKFSPMGNGLNRYVESTTIFDGRLMAVGWFNHMMEGGPTAWATFEPN